MSKVTVNIGKGFTLLPEGRQVLKITQIDNKEKFGKIEIHFVNKEGIKHTERFMLKTEGGLKVFSYLAHTILDNWDDDNVETEDLLEKFVSVEVVHNKVESTKTAGEFVTFANLKNYQFASGFEDDGDLPDDLSDALD